MDTQTKADTSEPAESATPLKLMEHTTHTSRDHFSNLPAEMILRITSYLERRDLKRLGSTNKQMHAILIPELYKDDLRNHDCSAMLWGCMEGNTDVIKTAIHLGQPLDRHFEQNHCPHTESIVLCRCSESKTKGRTPLIMALLVVQLDAAEYLIARGANVNMPESSLRSSLQIQSFQDPVHPRLWYPIHLPFNNLFRRQHTARYKAMAMLLKAGADPNQVSDQTGGGVVTPSMPSVDASVSPNILQLLLSSGADPSKRIPAETFGGTIKRATVPWTVIELLLLQTDSWLKHDGLEKFKILWGQANVTDIDISKLVALVLEHSCKETSRVRLEFLEELYHKGHLTLKDVMKPNGDFSNSLVAIINEFGVVEERYRTQDPKEEINNSYLRILTDFFWFFHKMGARVQHDDIPNTIYILSGSPCNSVDAVIEILLGQHPKVDFTQGTVSKVLHRVVNRDTSNYLRRPARRLGLLLEHGCSCNNISDKETVLERVCKWWYTFDNPEEVIQLLLDKGANVPADSNDPKNLASLLYEGADRWPAKALDVKTSSAPPWAVLIAKLNDCLDILIEAKVSLNEATDKNLTDIINYWKKWSQDDRLVDTKPLSGNYYPPRPSSGIFSTLLDAQKKKA